MRARWRSRLLGLAIAFACHYAGLSAAPEFLVLNSDSALSVVPNALSEDGTTVVGRANLNGGQAGFRWTEASGFESFGSVAGRLITSVNAVSSDNAIVAGTGTRGSTAHAVGFRRAAGGPNIPIFDIAATIDVATADVTAMSGDGNVLVGYHRDNLNRVRSFVWTTDDENPSNLAGIFTSLGELLPGTTRTTGIHTNRAQDISADGRYVAGWSDAAENSPSQVQAYRYDRETGTVIGLGFLSAESRRSSAEAISADGHAIAGESRSAAFNNQNEIFYWTASGGIMGTGAQFSSGHVFRLALSGDGLTVGSSTDQRAFIWTQENGIVFLDTIVPELATWTFSVVTALSHDASVIAGFGFPTEDTSSGAEVGWLIKIPATDPSPPLNSDPEIEIIHSGGSFLTLVVSGDALSTRWQYSLESSGDFVDWPDRLVLRPSGASAPAQVVQGDLGVISNQASADRFRVVIEVPLPPDSMFFRVVARPDN